MSLQKLSRDGTNARRRFITVAPCGDVWMIQPNSSNSMKLGCLCIILLPCKPSSRHMAWHLRTAWIGRFRMPTGEQFQMFMISTFSVFAPTHLPKFQVTEVFKSGPSYVLGSLLLSKVLQSLTHKLKFQFGELDSHKIISVESCSFRTRFCQWVAESEKNPKIRSLQNLFIIYRRVKSLQMGTEMPTSCKLYANTYNPCDQGNFMCAFKSSIGLCWEIVLRKIESYSHVDIIANSNRSYCWLDFTLLKK